MERSGLKFRRLPGRYAIVRLAHDATVPDWASLSKSTNGDFISITRTGDELSIVCPESQVPPGVKCESGWRCVRVAGKMDF